MVNLEKIKKETNKEVDNFLRNYYKNNKLGKKILTYREKCRYKDEDVRPLLVKFGYELFYGENKKEILPAMAAIHLDLLSFMPLDDIIDYFSSMEVDAGFIAKSFYLTTIMREDTRKILKYYKKCKNHGRILDLISEINIRLDGSQDLEANIHSKIPIKKYDINDYIMLIDEATSVMIAGPFLLGGLIAKVNGEQQKIIWNSGMELGRLGQIRDDFLDYIDPKLTGKVPFADLSEKRKRFPLLIAYKVGNEMEKNRIDEILKKENISQKDVYDMMEMITNRKVKKESRKIIDRIYNRAIKNLQQLPKNQPSYRFLEEITNLLAMKVG